MKKFQYLTIHTKSEYLENHLDKLETWELVTVIPIQKFIPSAIENRLPINPIGQPPGRFELHYLCIFKKEKI